MTEHVTISLDAEHLQRARQEANLLGVTLESYLSSILQARLPTSAPATSVMASISVIFGIGASAEPTDVGRDKDAMLSQAVCKEHERKTLHSS